MTRRKPRGLRPDEEELWDKVRHSAVPLHPSSRKAIKQAVEQKRTIPPQMTIPRFRIGESATSTAMPAVVQSGHSDHLAGGALNMDRKSFGRMKKGRLAPERRIDLHGMTLAQAHPALNGFIMESYAAGNRLVLVITGKGKDKPDNDLIPVRRGVLRYQVPHWLNSGPLKQAVLQVSQAHLKHGGSGAYYVYLRRQR